MKSISIICLPSYEPRSPALWKKVFKHVGEPENEVRIIRLERDAQFPELFGDATIIASPFKARNWMVTNFYLGSEPHNTDKSGLHKVLPWIPRFTRLAILGTGALAETLMEVLIEEGHNENYIWGRDEKKAQWFENEYNESVEAVPGEIDFSWFDATFNTIPYSNETNIWLWTAGKTRLFNLVWGPEADNFGRWQAAYAQSLVYDVEPEQCEKWMREE